MRRVTKIDRPQVRRVVSTFPELCSLQSSRNASLNAIEMQSSQLQPPHRFAPTCGSDSELGKATLLSTTVNEMIDNAWLSCQIMRKV